MNLQHMRTLVCIVEQGSLSAAARAKRISQPAVTKQVQRMEAELGLALLVLLLLGLFPDGIPRAWFTRRAHG
mgnify:CR=1 FL=1